EEAMTLGGNPRVLRLTAAALAAPGEAPAHAVVLVEDVTRAKRLERQMLLAERLTTAGRLAAGVAHGLNNPLATIAGCAEALLERVRDVVLEAMAGRGRLTIRTRVAGDEMTIDRAAIKEIMIEFVDEGPGIAEAVLPRIFDPFFTTKPPGQGTGLGLAIAQGIVADHGGRIEVQSRPGKGSVFRIVVPAQLQEAPYPQGGHE